MLALLLCAAATATVGYPSDVRVLGYDPVDRKVYTSSYGEWVQVSYVQLDRPDHWVQVQSWYQGPDWESRLEGRLAALEARLEPLPELDLTGLVIQETVTDVVPCLSFLDPCTARQVDVRVSLGDHDASWTQLSWGASGVTAAWLLPTGDPLILYSHIGRLYETGYQDQRAVVLIEDG